MEREEKKYNKWFAKERDKGLLDIKLVTDNINGVTREQFFKELNDINASVKTVIGEYKGLKLKTKPKRS